MLPIQPWGQAVLVLGGLSLAHCLNSTSSLAAVYGPTAGPPPGAPAGVTATVDESARARATSTRPFPVWTVVPAGSALRARRPTTTPFDALGSLALSSAAAPATIAADAEVPVIDVTPPPGANALIETPGAERNVSAP